MIAVTHDAYGWCEDVPPQLEAELLGLVPTRRHFREDEVSINLNGKAAVLEEDAPLPRIPAKPRTRTVPI